MLRKGSSKTIFLFIALLAGISPAWAAKDFYVKNNAQTFFYVSGTTGNIGIGSLTPGQLLDVQGTVRTAGFTMSGQTPISGYVLTASDSTGDTTWTSPGSVSGWTVTGNNVYETDKGNVGIGTFNPFGGNLIVNGGGNVGINSLTPGTQLDVNGTVRMQGFDLSNNGANNGYIMVSNGIGVGTWMNVNTLPAASIVPSAPGDMAYYSNTVSQITGSNNFVTNGTNVGIGTSGVATASLQIIGNVGIGTVANGDKFITTSPPKGGMIIESNVGIGTWVPSAIFEVGNQGFDVTSTGNVGIGTKNPSGGLEIEGPNAGIGIGTALTTTSALTIMNGSVGIGTWVPAAMFQVSNGTDPFVVDSKGNVGIGTILTSAGILSVMGGNVGIGTWVPVSALQVLGNVGIGTSTVPAYNLDLVNGTSRSRPVRRISTITETATSTVTINSNITDVEEVSGFNNAAGITLTFANPNPSNPNDEDLLEMRVKDGGTAITIAWGTGFASTTTTLPLTTVASTWLRILFEYNSTTSLWECVAST